MATTPQEVPSDPTFIPSPSFVITCACLTLDPATDTVLLARAPSDQPDAPHAHCVPQGPKNIDEGLLSAAVRHTLEATGAAIEPLRLRVPTRAGLWHYGDGHSSPREEGDVVEDLENCEPFAACEVSEGGVRRIVFYFLAGRKKRGEEGEEGGGVWVSVGDVERGVVGLSEEEGKVVRTGVELARRAGVMS
ncbi:hypothetical protein VUR80DRAFT_3910 [Thermomyces stellatus]